MTILGGISAFKVINKINYIATNVAAISVGVGARVKSTNLNRGRRTDRFEVAYKVGNVRTSDFAVVIDIAGNVRNSRGIDNK